jgi:hypothetical protein
VEDEDARSFWVAESFGVGGVRGGGPEGRVGGGGGFRGPGGVRG